MDRSQIPSLDDLRAFEAVARLGSVRRAADELALTHGAVSRRISKLAEDLGLSLFSKDGRGIRLTEVGETLNLTVGRSFKELAATIERLKSRTDEPNALVLSCEPSVAMRWLIPRLPRFQEEHPEISIHLSVGGGPVHFRRDSIELAIRRLDFSVPDSWHVERLFAEQVGPVMSPPLAPTFEKGQYVALGSKTRPDAWQRWLADHPSGPRPSEIRYYDHHFLVVEAAASGLGIAMCPLVLAADDLERKRLVAPFGFAPDGSHYGLIWIKSEMLSGRKFAVASWLKREVGTIEQICTPLS